MRTLICEYDRPLGFKKRIRIEVSDESEVEIEGFWGGFLVVEYTQHGIRQTVKLGHKYPNRIYFAD